jgi:hypothetical protein
MKLKHTLWMLEHQRKLVKKPHQILELTKWIHETEDAIYRLERKRKDTEVA